MAREDNSFLEAALVGYQTQAVTIAKAIADIKKRLGRGPAASASGPAVVKTIARKKRRISAEGRARIAEAQRKRWAAAKKSA